MSENSNYWVVDYSICPECPQEPAGDNGVPSPTTYETIDYCNKKNSEDEKIIRFFAELATDACGGPGQEYYEELGLNYNKVMTWLEKQKEQDKCPEYCVMSDCMGCPIYEKKKEQKPSIFPPGLGEVRWNPISSVQQKPTEGTDFTIYHPLKNSKGEYECIPYSFYGSLTSFSEDKDLIDFLRTCFYTEEECEEWIEKQKEQAEELSMRLNGVMQEYVKSGKDEEEQEHRLKCYQLFWDALGDSEFFEQKEQKPAEWSEDWREEDIQTRFAFYTYKDDPSVLYLSNVFVEETSRNHGFGTRILRAAEKVAEAIGATTISLKVKQNSPVNAWYRKNGYGYVAFEDGYDWLEKNLEYMKPNKQEWSEKDNIMLENIILCLKEYCLTDEINWLNSIKNWGVPIYKPIGVKIPTWKPSEEQMRYLKKVYESYYFCDRERTALESLYNDLEKLF